MSLKRLTILLLRDVSSPDEAIRSDKNPTSVALDPASGLTGRFYYQSSHSNPPSWVGQIDPILTLPLQHVFSSSASGLLIIETSGRHFAVTFGYGKGFIDPAKIHRH